jgi:hypothetical protein
MHSRSTCTLLKLAAFAIAAVMLSGPSFTGEPIPAGRVCEWRGTAPICAGECEPGEITFEKVQDAKYAQHEGFGNPCTGGNKVYCCRLTCPGGYHLEAGTVRERKCIEDSGVPVGTQIITLPQSPVQGTKREKGPIEAPSRVEGTELEKGPITTSEPAPPVPPAVPTPQPKPVKVLLPVDVYDDPGDKKKKIGVLKEETQGVFLVEPLRGDNWYNVKGNVPSGIGWVWSGPGYLSLEF